MAKVSPILANLNAGELSPQLEGRVDLQKYQSGAHRLENWIPRIQGGLQKRSGTRFAKEIKDSTKRGRLLPFEFSTTQAYVISLGDQTAQFIRNNGFVLESNFTVTGITNANPAVVTTSSPHGYSNGDEVFIAGVAGMTQVNNRYFRVAGVTGTTFQLSGTDSTNYGVFSGSGSVIIAASNAYQIDQGVSVADEGSGTCTTGPGGGVVHRSVFKFDIPANVPAGVTITSSTLSLSTEVLNGDPSADSYQLGGYNTNGQGDALSDGFTLAFSRADVSGAPYLTTTALRTVGIHAGLALGGTAVADIQTCLNGMIHGYSVAVRQVNESTSPATHGIEIAAELFSPSSHQPQLTVNYGSAAATVARVYTIATPYAAADLDGIQIAQSADVLYLAHQNYPPEKFQRFADANWVATAINFAWPPFGPENLSQTDYMVASADTGTGITLTSTGGHFNANMVGSFVKLREVIELQHAPWLASNDYQAHNPVSPAEGTGQNFNAFIAGSSINTGDRLRNDGKVYKLTNRFGSANFTGSVAPVHEEGIQSDGIFDWQFVNWGSGYAKITAFTDAFRVTADVIFALPLSTTYADKSISGFNTANPIQITVTAHGLVNGDKVFLRGISSTRGTALNNQSFIATVVDANNFTVPVNGTGLAGSGGIMIRVDQPSTTVLAVETQRNVFWRWSLAAWSVDQGYPRTVCFFEDRLWWAGSKGIPQGIWASRTGDYENHNVKSNNSLTDDADGLFFRVQTQDVNVIEWTNPGKDGIALGTASGEFLLNSGTSQGSAVTSRNIYVSRHTRSGVRAAASPVRINNFLIFVQRSGRALYEWLWNWQTDSYSARDLAVYAEHLGLNTIQKIAWAQEPNRIIWSITTNGNLLGFSYVREQEVESWHRHPVSGLVESHAIIPHPDGTQDQLWLIVNRTIQGTTKRYVEFLEEPWIATNSLPDAFFVDSGNTYSGTATSTIFGLEYLNGQTVSILADGIVVPNQTVTNGTITLTNAASKVQVGVPLSAILETERLEGGGQDGTSQGKRKRIVNLTVRLFQAGKGLMTGPSADQAIETFRYVDTQGNDLADNVLLDGDTALLPYPGRHEREARIALVHATPLPCTVLAIMPQFETQDR